MATATVSSEQKLEDEILRKRVHDRLCGDFKVELEPRAYTHSDVQLLVNKLQMLDENDIDGKLRMAGFTLAPYGEGEDEQACETCMYYQVHRKFCELPELMLPVESQWSCRLWRI